ncbi:MAG: YceI family protein [Actinobacteria bacterium]|nr:YceI family protein [Actinomycetota bacterium]
MSTITTERPVTIPAGTWTLDPVHSAVSFRVVDKTQFFATVNGRFEEFEGTVEAGETLDDLKIRGRIKADSITTSQEQRDAHLKSPDFLNVSSNPEILFESTRVEEEEGKLRILGTLTMTGAPQEIELVGEIHAAGHHEASGTDRVLVSAEGELEFGPITVDVAVDATALKA